MAGTTITLPPGAFAAAKTGQTVAPQPAAPKGDAATAAKPAGKPEAKPAAPAKETPKPAQAKADSKPAAADTAQDNMTAAEKRIRKLKANGREVEFDLGDEAAVIAHLEKALGADDTFRSAAQMRQQAERFFGMLKDPAKLREVLTDPRVGVDLKKFAEDYVWEQIQAQQREEEFKKDPAKRQAWENEQKVKKYEAEEQARKDAEKQRKIDEDAKRYEGDYEAKILKALEASGVPQEERAVRRMVEYIETALENNLDLSADDIVQQVRQDYYSDISSMLTSATGEQILEFLGEANAKKVREAEVKRLKDPASVSFPKRSGERKASQPTEPAKVKKVAGNVWKDDLIKGFLSRSK